MPNYNRLRLGPEPRSKVRREGAARDNVMHMMHRTASAKKEEKRRRPPVPSFSFLSSLSLSLSLSLSSFVIVLGFSSPKSVIFFPARSPKPGRAEEEINKFSRTFPTKIPKSVC